MRTLLTTTALVALLATGAVAQDAASASTDNLLEQGYQLVDTDGLASKLLGFPVYSSAADDAEQLGEINDIVIGQDGEVTAVIIGVGGFLGVGEKNVAVNYEEIEWTIAADDTERLVLDISREQLEAAVAVELIEDQPQETAAVDDQMAVEEPVEGEAMEAAEAPEAEQPAEDMQVAEEPAAEQPAEDEMQVAEQPAEQQPVDENLQTGAIPESGAVPADDGMAPLDTAVLTEFDESGLTAEQLIGVNAYGPNNEHIGTIGDFVLGEEQGTVDAIIIDFGGFLGIGVKEVAIAYEDLNFYSDEAGNISLLLNVTREQMEQATAFNRETYKQERDSQRLVVGSL